MSNLTGNLDTPAGPRFSLAGLALVLLVPLVMGNLGALVDGFLHPEISYFDEEHLIVGGITALVTVFFLIILAVYLEDLRKSRREIQVLNQALERKFEERTRQLHEAQEELVQKEKLALLGLIAGGMGNELRNPLGVMSNAVFFLKSALPDADGTVREYLDIIKDEIDSSLRIISDLLDFYRSKKSLIKPMPAHELVEQSLKGCDMPENVRLRTDFADCSAAILVDPKQMEQALRNLISNALQAMPGGGELRVAVRESGGGLAPPQGREGEPEGSSQAGFLEICVVDTGEGIAPEHMEKLFQPLFSTRSRGIGLGLALSKKFTEINGGRIRVESELGKGSRFTVKLPVDAAGR